MMILQHCLYTLRGSNSAILNFPFLLDRDQLLKNEFAPLGANSILSDKTPIWKGVIVQEH